MNESINIHDFVGRNDVRAWMNQPIQIAGKLAATDGKAVFLSNEPSDLPSPETNSIEKIEQFLESAASADFQPMPELKFPEMPDCIQCGGSGKHSLKDCPECDGFGLAEAQTDYNTYEVECRTCSGHGKVDAKQAGEDCGRCKGTGKRWTDSDRMKVEGIPCDMNPGLMSRIANVPGMQIAVIHNDATCAGLAFKCADGIGVIMGMRAPREASA